jgi:hypothetical protein
MSEQTPPEGDRKTFNYVVVPDTAEGSESTPQAAAADDIEAFKKGLKDALFLAKKGWAFPYVNGERCLLSSPIQMFILRLPDGTTIELRENAPEFPEDGRFRCLTVED